MNFAPTGQQTISQREVDSMLRDVSMEPRGHNPRVLGVNMLAMMTAKNNGYPKHMYHATLEMRVALKEEEQLALEGLGYSPRYIERTYPKTLFRRNMAANFEPKFELSTGIQINNGFVEERTVRDAEAEKALRLMKPKQGQSDWFDRITDVPEIEAGPAEDPKVTISRLEGMVAGLQGELAKKPAKKGEQVAA